MEYDDSRALAAMKRTWFPALVDGARGVELGGSVGAPGPRGRRSCMAWDGLALDEELDGLGCVWRQMTMSIRPKRRDATSWGVAPYAERTCGLDAARRGKAIGNRTSCTGNLGLYEGPGADRMEIAATRSARCHLQRSQGLFRAVEEPSMILTGAVCRGPTPPCGRD